MSQEHESEVDLSLSAGGRADLPSLNEIVLTDADGKPIVRLNSTDLFKIYTAWLVLLDQVIKRDSADQQERESDD